MVLFRCFDLGFECFHDGAVVRFDKDAVVVVVVHTQLQRRHDEIECG